MTRYAVLYMRPGRNQWLVVNFTHRSCSLTTNTHWYAWAMANALHANDYKVRFITITL